MFSYLITFISFCLDISLSKYLFLSTHTNNYLIPMFTIISFILLLPYFKTKKDYLIYIGIFGFLYDIMITDTLILNLVLFLLIGSIIIFLDNRISHCYISNIFKFLIIIFIYDLLTYSILIINGYIDYSFVIFLKKYVSSLLLNFIYVTILYFFTNYLSKKFKIKKTYN